MTLSVRQLQALRAMPLQADKETCHALRASPSHLCGTLSLLGARGLAKHDLTRSDYGRPMRRWALTAEGEKALAGVQKETQR